MPLNWRKVVYMKNLVYLILLVPLFGLSSCGSKICCTPAQRPGELTAQRNGANWSPLYVGGFIGQTDSITMMATNIQPATFTKLDTLCLKISYSDNGTYKLTGNQVFYGTFNTNGAVTSYQLDPSFNNEITITGFEVLYNPATLNPDPTKVTGTFNLKFIDPNNPAGISFLDGNFYCIMSRK
jgi:hypothetical protein